MSEFSEYFNRHIEEIRRFQGGGKYFLKSRRRYRDCLSLVFDYLKAGGKSVLDLGGWQMGALCAPLASSVLCVSLSAPKTRLEAAFPVTAEVFDIMAPEFPLDGQSFDLVFFLEVLEHLPPPTDLVMRRLRALIRPGGYMVMSVPNLAFWQKRIKFFLLGRSPLKLSDERDPYGGYHHIRPYTYDECLKLFRRFGLRVERRLSGNYHRGWYHYPFHSIERLAPRLAHKLIFLVTPEDEGGPMSPPSQGSQGSIAGLGEQGTDKGNPE
jgi:SAM-dependent methyltransferase